MTEPNYKLYYSTACDSVCLAAFDTLPEAKCQAVIRLQDHDLVGDYPSPSEDVFRSKTACYEIYHGDMVVDDELQDPVWNSPYFYRRPND